MLRDPAWSQGEALAFRGSVKAVSMLRSDLFSAFFLCLWLFTRVEILLNYVLQEKRVYLSNVGLCQGV